MKKFLFTLVALLTTGSMFAQENYLYVPDIELTQEQAAAGVQNYALFVKAHFDQYVTTVDWTINFPEGVEFVSANMPNAAKPYIYQYVDVEDDDTGEIVSTLVYQRMNPQLFGDYPHYITTTSLGATSDQCYSEDGSVCYGAPKWGGDGVEFNFYRFVVNIAPGFTGGNILVHSECVCTDDPRGNICEGAENDKECPITVEKPAAEPAPVPTFSWNEETFTMTVACENHEVVLMIGDEVVENPYTATQSYEEQSITFTAYTVANADESGNSATVEQTVTVPAKAKTPSNKPVVNVELTDDEVIITATGTGEVKLYVNGEEIAQPVRIDRPEYGQQPLEYVAKASNMDSDPNGQIQYELTWSDEVDVTVPVKEPVWQTVAAPVITTSQDDDNVYVHVEWPTTTGGRKYTGEDSYARGEQDYEVTVEAYTEENYPYRESEHATKTFTVPAKETTPVEPGETTTYVKVTSTDQLVAGQKYIFVYEDAPFAMSNMDGASVAVTLNGNEVEAPETVMAFTMAMTTSFGSTTYTFTNDGTMLGGARISGSGSSAVWGPVAGGYNTAWSVSNVNGTLNGYVARNNEASRYLKVSTYNSNFILSTSSSIPYAFLYVEKTEAPVLQDLAGTIEFGEPTADGKVAVSYTGNEAGVVVTVEGYEVVDGMIQLPEYGTYTLNATATADGYNPLNVEGTVTWSAPVLPTLGGYFVWSTLDEDGHFTVTYNNFDYDGPYTLVVKDEDGNVMNPEVGDAGEYYQAAEGTHTYTVEVTAPGYQVKADTHEYTYTVITYAPKPMLSWNEETFTMTAFLGNREYTNDDIELYMNNDKVENPKTVAQTYQPQSLEFKARTIGKDGDENSEWAYMNVTVPAKEKTASNEPTISVAEGDDAYVITAEGTGTVVMYDADGNEIANPYTVTRTDEQQVIIVKVVNTDEDTDEVMYKPTEKTFTVIVPAKAPVLPETPVITPETTDAAVIVTATTTDGSTVVLYQCDDAEGTNPRVIDNPTAFARENADRTVYVYAVATNEDGSTQSEVTAINVPAKPITPPDPTSINEMNGGKAIANVRYFNMAGQEMQEANGMTIVVTTYTDGTSSAVKVMK